MTQQPDDATPRVVKKVVKKTVVRPVSTTPPAARPSQRPTRLTTPARAQATRTATPSPARPASPRTAPTTRQPAVKSPTARVTPTRRRPSLPKPDIRGRVSDLGHGIGDRIGDFGRGIGDRIVDAWDWIISIRLPYLSPAKGSAVAGIIVGLLSVTIGWGFYKLFSATLGTQAGGGWGFLAFVCLSFFAFIVGELLLSGFGVPHARVVSILSVLLVLLLVLIFFIRLAAGIWAWPLIPTLCAICFVASSAIMSVATKEENDQRLPWEPTHESQVKTD